MKIDGFRLTRFQYRRDRINGDSHVLKTYGRHFGGELTTDSSVVGIETRASLSYLHPLRYEIVCTIEEEPWLILSGRGLGGDCLQGFRASRRQFAAHVIRL